MYRFPLPPDQADLKLKTTLKICEHRPPVKPPKRDLEFFRFQAKGIAVICTNCKRKPGKFTCSSCLAVRFCSAQCQKEFWPGHKEMCNGIKFARQMCKESIDKINEDNVLSYDKMKKLTCKGQLDWTDFAGDEPAPPGVFSWSVDKIAAQNYLISRQSLMHGYSSLGEESKSPLAYRLASENALDMLCMSYKTAYGEKQHREMASWMVAAGMDQVALNYLVYFNTRRYSKTPLPYMDLDSMGADIEAPGILDTLLGENPDDHHAPFFPEHHIYLIGTLLKYKKLQHNMMERRKSVVKWKSFLMGTHPKIGKDSPIQKLRGNHTVLEKIQNMIVRKELADKLKKEPMVISNYLKKMEIRWKSILPQLIDPHHRDNLRWPRRQERGRKGQRFLHDDAWRMSPAYHQILFKYMETGKITDKPWHEPMEGFHQASIDTDPSKDYDDCSEFSLMCLKTGSKSSVHICKP